MGSPINENIQSNAFSLETQIRQQASEKSKINDADLAKLKKDKQIEIPCTINGKKYKVTIKIAADLTGFTKDNLVNAFEKQILKVLSLAIHYKLGEGETNKITIDKSDHVTRYRKSKGEKQQANFGDHLIKKLSDFNDPLHGMRKYRDNVKVSGKTYSDSQLTAVASSAFVAAKFFKGFNKDLTFSEYLKLHPRQENFQDTKHTDENMKKGGDSEPTPGEKIPTKTPQKIVSKESAPSVSKTVDLADKIVEESLSLIDNIGKNPDSYKEKSSKLVNLISTASKTFKVKYHDTIKGLGTVDSENIESKKREYIRLQETLLSRRHQKNEQDLAELTACNHILAQLTAIQKSNQAAFKYITQEDIAKEKQNEVLELLKDIDKEIYSKFSQNIKNWRYESSHLLISILNKPEFQTKQKKEELLNKINEICEKTPAIGPRMQIIISFLYKTLEN